MIVSTEVLHYYYYYSIFVSTAESDTNFYPFCQIYVQIGFAPKLQVWSRSPKSIVTDSYTNNPKRIRNLQDGFSWVIEDRAYNADNTTSFIEAFLDVIKGSRW